MPRHYKKSKRLPEKPKYRLPENSKYSLMGLMNGGTGRGRPVLVHKGEIIMRNPFKSHFSRVLRTP